MQPLMDGMNSFARTSEIFEDAIVEALATKQQRQTVSTPRKYADPQKKRKRKAAQKSRRKNRR